MLYHPVKAGNLEIPGNLFLAPVAGYSDRAFRSVCAVWGADFAFTERKYPFVLQGKTEFCVAQRMVQSR